jgi:hypothetical protein
MWSYYDIKDSYCLKFKEEFSEYMNQEITDKLWFAGQSFEHSVRTFVKLNPTYSLTKLLNFVDMFLTEQLGDFGNWDHVIAAAMYDEDDDPIDMPTQHA